MSVNKVILYRRSNETIFVAYDVHMSEKVIWLER